MPSALAISDLRYRYRRRDPWVVDVAHLDLAPGEPMLLTGGSGQGKSTLLHLISGLMDPLGGRVLIGGHDIHALHGAKRDLFRGRHVGVIFQSFNLLHGFTAQENVMAALMFSAIPRRQHRRRARTLLQRLDIDHPHRNPDRMSVGQQQRVAVARAVACEPDLVLADEPTASLDPENAEIAMQLIREVCREQGAALLCVSHDPAMEPRFERRASLEELSKAGSAQDRPDDVHHESPEEEPITED